MMVIARTGRRKVEVKIKMMMMMVMLVTIMMANTVPLNARYHANYLIYNMSFVIITPHIILFPK